MTTASKRARMGTGWRTTDADEIERRRKRAETEAIGVSLRDSIDKPYGLYQVVSAAQRSYRVELRSLDERINTCECPDFLVNGLGTCKHIEAVLRTGLAPPARRRVTEIFLDRRNQYDGGVVVRIVWADRLRADNKVRRALEPLFSADGRLLGAPLKAMPAVDRALLDYGLGPDRVRVSRDIGLWVESLSRQRERHRAREAWGEDLARGKRELDFLKLPLYPYQRHGMLHLAFNERAILADEMGLGKTVQAIAACELLRRLHGIARVLVLSPVSLKTEWEEQIGKFTTSDLQIIQGNAARRQRQYKDAAFYNLGNYEQLLTDEAAVNRELAPDVIILDEAQRIKNWQTKTADAVKRLNSRCLFVLTGTPLENRIDEIYSIAQAIDPHLLGPLFRFNREFYTLDERGRPVGYRNLDRLHRRLEPILLRRRKADVEGELPPRTVNNYFVELAPAQSEPYTDYSGMVARLAAIARRRPLTAKEMKRLHSYLACMRMLCDTPYILDPNCRVSPKLDELGRLLPELLEDPDNKILVFSEWTRMLELVAGLAEKLEIGFAVHSGEVTQRKRRAEINRFKGEPDCRLLLSSDSGATGLNLQAANIVINLDLPWNPARLEQRIARAWRKHQTRPVSVINLVSTNSIEHRMLHLLDAKKTLAEGVVDGSGLTEMELPSGRQATLDRLSNLMDLEPAALTATAPVKALKTDDLAGEIEARHPGSLERLDLVERPDGGRTVVAVVHGDAPEPAEAVRSLATRCDADAEALIVDADTMATIEQLVAAGVLSFAPHRRLHGKPRDPAAGDRQKARIKQARADLAAAERKLRMARVLIDGGFGAEAVEPLAQAVETALSSLARAREIPHQAPVDPGLLKPELASGHLATVALARTEPGEADHAFLDGVETLVAHIGQRLDQWSLGG